MTQSNTITVGSFPLSLEDLTRVARREARLVLSSDPAFRERIDACAAFLARLLAEGTESTA